MGATQTVTNRANTCSALGRSWLEAVSAESALGSRQQGRRGTVEWLCVELYELTSSSMALSFEVPSSESQHRYTHAGLQSSSFLERESARHRQPGRPGWHSVAPYCHARLLSAASPTAYLTHLEKHHGTCPADSSASR